MAVQSVEAQRVRIMSISRPPHQQASLGDNAVRSNAKSAHHEQQEALPGENAVC